MVLYHKCGSYMELYEKEGHDEATDIKGLFAFCLGCEGAVWLDLTNPDEALEVASVRDLKSLIRDSEYYTGDQVA